MATYASFSAYNIQFTDHADEALVLLADLDGFLTDHLEESGVEHLHEAGASTIEVSVWGHGEISYGGACELSQMMDKLADLASNAFIHTEKCEDDGDHERWRGPEPQLSIAKINSAIHDLTDTINMVLKEMQTWNIRSSEPSPPSPSSPSSSPPSSSTPSSSSDKPDASASTGALPPSTGSLSPPSSVPPPAPSSSSSPPTELSEQTRFQGYLLTMLQHGDRLMDEDDYTIVQNLAANDYSGLHLALSSFDNRVLTWIRWQHSNLMSQMHATEAVYWHGQWKQSEPPTNIAADEGVPF